MLELTVARRRSSQSRPRIAERPDPHDTLSPRRYSSGGYRPATPGLAAVVGAGTDIALGFSRSAVSPGGATTP